VIVKTSIHAFDCTIAGLLKWSTKTVDDTSATRHSTEILIKVRIGNKTGDLSSRIRHEQATRSTGVSDERVADETTNRVSI